MLLNPKKWIVAGLVLLPLQAIAGTSTVSFGTINVNGTTYSSGEPSSNFNQFTVDAGGITINVSGWSDTAGSSGTSPNIDPIIERAVDLDRNQNGWALINADERNADGTPTQKCGYSHSADNYDCSYTDYDFFVLDFGTTDVEISSVYSSWIANRGYDQQVSVAAIDPDFDPNGKSLTDLFNATGGSASSTFQSSANVSNYYADVNVGVSSTLWVVSAYHTMFGDIGAADNNNDGFKLAGITFSESSGGGSGTPVPEPTTIAMFMLALLGLSTNRRKI